MDGAECTQPGVQTAFRSAWGSFDPHIWLAAVFPPDARPSRARAKNGSIAADNAHVLCDRQYRAGSGNARLTVHDMLGEQIHPRPQVLRPTIFWMNIQFTSTFDGRSNMRKKMLNSKPVFRTCQIE